jgi:hypothetical protein
MLEIGTSGLMSGEGKRATLAPRLSSTLPILEVQPEENETDCASPNEPILPADRDEGIERTTWVALAGWLPGVNGASGFLGILPVRCVGLCL